MRTAPVLAAAAAVLAGAVTPGTPASAAGAPSGRPAGTTVTAAADLPFDLPAPRVLRASPRKVFAHYLPSMPVSFDNRDPAADYWSRNYLAPDGERGKHAAYGGFTRDRPLGRPARTGDDWRLRDLQDEVRQAVSAGLDGFSVDLLSLRSDHYTLANTRLLIRAAETVDPEFSIMLVPDMTTSVGRLEPEQLADSVAGLAASPSVLRLADGRLVVAPFKAEVHDAAWWTRFLRAVRDRHAIRVALVPTFLDERPHRAAFAPISHAMSIWGSRNPRHNDPGAGHATSPIGRIRQVHDLGPAWMQPVSYQDERPRSGIFDEAENTTNLRRTWQIARDGGAEWVQLTTWNDYAEGSHLAPSGRHGWTPLDITAYYLTWYKTGQAPRIVRDAVYLTHRTQPHAARPRGRQTLLMRPRGGSPARDTVEALAFTTGPATVILRVGHAWASCRLPGPGVHPCTVPLPAADLPAGSVIAEVVRDGRVVAGVASREAVSRAPQVQDLQYVSVSSLREGTGAPGPGRPVAMEVEAVADTWLEGAAPGRGGPRRSLAARGVPRRTAHLRFRIPPAPAGLTLRAATLRLHTTDGRTAGSLDSHELRSVPGAWPGTGRDGAPVGKIPAGIRRDRGYSVPLDTGRLAPLAGRGLALVVTGSGTDTVWFWSRYHPDPALRPRLRLTYG